jgi:O-antigen/teichoic acid export membrane protein
VSEGGAIDSDAQGRSIWSRIWRDFFILGAGNVGVVVIQLLFRGILIVKLLPESYGRLALVLTIYNAIWIFANSGLPNGIARYISINSPANDLAVLRSAVRAAALPTVIVALVMGGTSAAILGSPLAALFGAVGVSCLVYSQLSAGALRGRRRIASAATIMPVAAIAEVAGLAAILVLGLSLTSMSAFGAFCLGNVIGLLYAGFRLLRTAPATAPSEAATDIEPPTSRQLLGFSLWLAGAAAGLAALPVIIRFAAALDSYTEAAIVDLALVIFTIPQRAGAIIALAVIPHASRAARSGKLVFKITLRQHFLAIVPFVLIAILLAATPLIEWLADAIGRPEYENSGRYAALVMLAGPARVLYGLTVGVLIAHGEGRFLALTVWAILLVTSVVIFASTTLGDTIVAFAAFVAGVWILYLIALTRAERLSAPRSPAAADAGQPVQPQLAKQGG